MVQAGKVLLSVGDVMGQARNGTSRKDMMLVTKFESMPYSGAFFVILGGICFLLSPLHDLLWCAGMSLFLLGCTISR